MQVSEAVGASAVIGQLIVDSPGSGSMTFTEVSVTLPLLVTR